MMGVSIPEGPQRSIAFCGDMVELVNQRENLFMESLVVKSWKVDVQDVEIFFALIRPSWRGKGLAACFFRKLTVFEAQRNEFGEHTPRCSLSGLGKANEDGGNTNVFERRNVPCHVGEHLANGVCIVEYHFCNILCGTRKRV